MKKILIVDDSIFMQTVLKDILSQKLPEHKLIKADTGANALKQFRKESPDVILLDIIMPEGEQEGLRVLREIIKFDPKVKVVMITAVGQNSMIKECKELGAVDYIVKPFDEKQVIETVEKHLG